MIPETKRIAIDSECTGLDLYHGARPYLVTTCNDSGENVWWEWSVDPLTREVQVSKSDVEEIQLLIDSADELILQNSKFDCGMLEAVGIRWPWHKVQDTLIAGHLLASNQPHDLTSMALQYLGVDIEPLEKSLEHDCNEARRLARKSFKAWRIAKEGLEDMPSAKASCWKADTWLPKALAKELKYPSEHHWWTVAETYANGDSATTLALWEYMRKELVYRDLWNLYKERMKLLPVAYRMEKDGVTISSTRLEELTTEYREESQRAERVCVNIASSYGYELSLPKSGNNQALVKFCFDKEGLGLPAVKRSKKTGAPSLDKGALESYEATLPAKSKALLFIQTLKGKRKRDTAISYMENYHRFWKPLGGKNGHVLLTPGTCPCDESSASSCPVCDGGLAICQLCGKGECELDEPCPKQDWFVLHPSMNVTGTDTLRWSSSNPNSQNCGKQGMYEGDPHTIRYCFGPAPGREWWSLDYQNIELRIPAYESGETAMIELFEKPDDPPYFGSYHLLNASLIYPELFWPLADQKGAFKKKYGATYYQWDKNFGFAFQYSGGEETCDRAARRKGSYRAVKDNLKELTRLNGHYVQYANKYGYVETIPDKTVSPRRGYPILCARSESGHVLPTTPLNYHVQSTAMWCTAKAMVRVQDQLDAWNGEAGSETYRMCLQVHDELVLDFPKGDNLERIRVVQRLMEKSGDDIGIPLTVGVEFHEFHWGKGESR